MAYQKESKKYSDAEKAEYWRKKFYEGNGNGGSRNSGGGASRSRGRSNDDYTKHSGCAYGQDKNSNPYVRGWKFDKTNGMRSFLAVPYKSTKKIVSKNGVKWENWMVKVSPQGGKPYIVSGLYQPETKKVIIPDLQFIMNPKGGKGGYVGPFYTRK